MEKNPKSEIIFQLPAGFRFHPSDEELIVHYLGKKANKFPLPASIVAEVELYKFNPWDLPSMFLFLINFLHSLLHFFFFYNYYQILVSSDFTTNY